ncbi:MAG TPA: patatin-like phospholipase family protein [Edaphobacter sp.]|nr:patatin-like phospholipase family protein [Edaphobacter sp.]
MDRYRILSLDGGGSWALIQVKALIELYGPDKLGRDVIQDFHLVAANSGGSIVLGCLVENFSLSKILAFFNDKAQRKAIFSQTDSIEHRALHAIAGLGPKYSEKNKLPALQKVLPQRGNLSLLDAVAGIRRPGASEDLHILITSFDYDRNQATFFRSAAATGPEWGHEDASKITLAEAIHASTNAPVNYFDAPARFPDRDGRYWDGGISGCNNPVLVAVTEAVVKGQAPTNIVALSIGTASVALPEAQPGEQLPLPYVRDIIEPGIKNDLSKLASSILDDPPDIATFLAHVMTGSGIGLGTQAADSRIVRMSPLVSPVKKVVNGTAIWSAPGSMTAAQFKSLKNLDFDAVEQPQIDEITQYADLWVKNEAPNQPIRMNGSTLVRELGQDTFGATKSAWEAIK